MDKTEFSARIDADMPQFRSLPFWSWNDELETDELRFQIRRMKEAGIGGYFMHARGGLTTPYMGEKWMDAIAACLKEGENEGMESWAYDENGWPSGFADGEVPKMGEAYQQKGLDFAVLDESLTLPKRTLGVYRLCGGSACRVDTPAAGDTAVFVTINRYYIDALNADAVTAFLRCTHERYYARFREDFGTRLKGFFTDEPQYANGLIPWSPVLDEAFFAEWGYDPKDKLGAFYLSADEDRAFRWQYYRTASRLFGDGFIRQMGDWCRDHGVRLTGHLMAEDSLLSQLRSTGGVMSGYEYFDMPGIDWLGRGIASPVVPRQLGSAAAQLGKRQTLSESFALCGWDVSFNELRHIAQWQFVNGVNRLCSHLSAYSLRGLRKRDYPPSLHTQLPWFSADAVLQDYFARTGAALAQGQEDVDVLLLSPLGVAAGHHNRADERELCEISYRFDCAAAELAGQHLLHHYGDETLLRRHGRVEGGCLIVGQMRYRTVILPYMDSIAPETAALLTAFIRSGGRVLALGAAPLLCGYVPDAAWAAMAAALPVLPDAAAAATALADGRTPHVLNADGGEEPLVHVMRRRLKDGRTLLYLVSLSPETLGTRTLRLMGEQGFAEVSLTGGGEQVLPHRFDGENTVFSLSFAPAESHLLISCDPSLPAAPVPPTERLAFAPRWQVAERTPNLLTMDTAAYRIDGGAWQPEKAVILIQQELLARKCPCRIDLRFTFTVQGKAGIPQLELLLEQPQQYTLTLNGAPLPFADNGWAIDRAFRRCVIGDAVREGENELILSGEFFQRQEVYDVLFGENVHEAERNKLTFDTELESLYLMGDFGVTAAQKPEYGARRTVWAGRQFALTPPTDTVYLPDILQDGYWFFSGHLRVAQSVTVARRAGVRYTVEAAALHVPAARVYVNGKEAGVLALAPFAVDVTDHLRDGENTVELELLTGNRNLFGPHHRVIGESYLVGPATFTDGPDWEGGDGPFWRDDYCFVTTGITLA